MLKSRRLILTASLLLATALPCLAGEQHLTALRDVGERIQVPLYDHITVENIEKVFSYPLLEPGLYGAKAVVVSLYGQAPTIYFYAIGDENSYYGTKHYQGLEVAVKEQQLLSEQNFQIRTLPMSYQESLKYSQGFQLQAKKIDGQWKVVGFEIDSSIVTDQIKDKIPVSKRLQNSMLVATVNAIDPKLAVFKKPDWHFAMNWDCKSDLQKPSPL
jgi:hypothetical protein